MNLKLIVIGKLKTPALADLCAEFTKRIGYYSSIEILELKDEKIRASQPVAEVLQREATRIEAVIDRNSAICLDVKGRQFSSVDLARRFEEYQIRGQKELQFVIGGPHGLHPAIIKQCHLRWSLSKLTFPHEMARYIVLEQVYRAFTILRGESYHK